MANNANPNRPRHLTQVSVLAMAEQYLATHAGAFYREYASHDATLQQQQNLLNQFPAGAMPAAEIVRQWDAIQQQRDQLAGAMIHRLRVHAHQYLQMMRQMERQLVAPGGRRSHDRRLTRVRLSTAGALAAIVIAEAYVAERRRYDAQRKAALVEVAAVIGEAAFAAKEDNNDDEK